MGQNSGDKESSKPLEKPGLKPVIVKKPPPPKGEEALKFRKPDSENKQEKVEKEKEVISNRW